MYLNFKRLLTQWQSWVWSSWCLHFIQRSSLKRFLNLELHTQLMSVLSVFMFMLFNITVSVLNLLTPRVEVTVSVNSEDETEMAVIISNDRSFKIIYFWKLQQNQLTLSVLHQSMWDRFNCMLIYIFGFKDDTTVYLFCWF